MLRKASRGISQELVQVFDITSREVDLYLQAIDGGIVEPRFLSGDAGRAEAVISLVARGMLIEGEKAEEAKH